MKIFICFFIFLVFYQTLKANDTIVLHHTKKEYEIGQQMQYLEDKTNQLTFNQLLTDKYITKFKPLNQQKYTSSTPNSGAVWFKFILKNNSSDGLNFVLNFIKTSIYEADLYFIDRQNLINHLKTGIRFPLEKRAYKSLSPAFRIELLPQETKIYYLRIYSVSFHHIIPNLIEEEHFEEISHDKFAFWGLFYGLVFFMFCFNIVLYIFYREKKILYFVIHCFFMAIFTSSIDGFLFVYAHILIAWTNGFQTLVTSGIFICFVWLFIKESLQLRTVSRFANRLVMFFAVFALTITFSGLLEQSWGFWLGIMNIPPAFVLLLYISYLIYKKNISHGYSLLGVLWAFLILGSLNILSLLNILPLNIFTRWNFHIAFVIEIIILTIGFIYDFRKLQLRFIKNEKEKHSKINNRNTDLEQKISASDKVLEMKTQQLESILESSPDYIYSFDKDLNLLTANSAALERMKTYGYSFVLGVNLKKIFPKQIYNFLEPLLIETLNTKKTIVKETQGRKTQNKRANSYVMTFNPIFSKTNEVIGVSLFIRDISEEVKMKKKLIDNENFLLTIFDGAPDALFLIDKDDLSIQRCNATAMKMFEFETLDILSAFENNIPFSKEKLKEISQIIIKQKEWATEMRYINRSGHNFWGEIKCSHLIIQKEAYLLVRITDIDHRKKAEEHVKYLNRQMKAILENANDPIFAIDTNYRYTVFNEIHKERMKYVYGKSIKLGDSILEHLNIEEDELQFKMDVDKAMLGQQFFAERCYGDNKTRNRIFEATYNPIKNENNEITGVAIFAREITQRKKQEAIIIQKETNLRAILETNDFAIWMVNMDLNLIDFNKSFAHFFKFFYDIDVKIGNNFFTKELKENYTKETSERMAYILAGNIGDYTDTYILKERKYIFNLKGFPIFENGKIVGAVCFSQNITQIKKNEVMLKKKNKALKKVNNELDKFVYSASHDLRAPLSSILGLISLLNSDSSEEEKQMYYNLMKKSIKKLDDFIQQIVHYSRNARIGVIPEKIDLNELIDYSIENLQYMTNSQKIKTHIDNNPQIDVVTDKFRLGVILNNLISNAFRYADMRKEQPFINITIEANETNIKLKIEDNGQGIDEKYLPKIFDMFYRANETNTGSGLGLYILKETLSILKGTIKVDSKYGFGTTFEINIPNLLNHKKEQN